MPNLRYFKNFIRQNIIEPLSIHAVHDVINNDSQLKEVWQDSLTIIPDVTHHYSAPVDNKEVECRIRLLIAAETVFIRKVIKDLIVRNGVCHYADIGDSDGSVRLLLKKYFPEDTIQTIGINLQKGAVEKIKRTGLDAICSDALSLGQMGVRYDVVSAFETLEHLPDPIGFFKQVKPIVNHTLVISVPWIRRSRVSLLYLTNRWPMGKKATIENTHIFELSPRDWGKIFRHTGWRIEEEQRLLMFPVRSLSRFILEPFWRYMSFEGFWFVRLVKSEEFSSRFYIE